MKIPFKILIVSLLAAGCGTESGKGKDVIYFDVDHPVEKSFFDFFDRVDIIPLETNDSSIIADYTNAQEIYQDTLYLLFSGTGNGKGIYSFDLDGHYLGKFYRPGNGPDDHGFISDFHINPYTGQLAVWEPPAGRLSIYDRKTGKKEWSIEMNSKWGAVYGVNRFYPLSADKYVFFTDAAPGNMEKKGQLLYYNVSTDSLYRQFLDIPEIIVETNYMGVGRPFSLIDGEVFLDISYLNTMFRYDGNNFIPYKRLDFGKYGHIENYYVIFPDKPRREAIDYLFDNDDRYAIFISSPMYTGRQIMFAGKHDKKFPLLVFDRRTGESMFVNKMKEGVYVLPDFQQQGEYTYKLSSVNSIHNYVNENVLDGKNLINLRALNEQDNPVLLRYKIKN